MLTSHSPQSGLASEPRPQQTKCEYYVDHYQSFCFGNKKDGKNIEAIVRVRNMMNGNVYRDYDRALSQGHNTAKVCFRPIEVSNNQRYMFMDLIQPIHAIYIPTAQ